MISKILCTLCASLGVLSAVSAAPMGEGGWAYKPNSPEIATTSRANDIFTIPGSAPTPDTSVRYTQIAGTNLVLDHASGELLNPTGQVVGSVDPNGNILDSSGNHVGTLQAGAPNTATSLENYGSKDLDGGLFLD